MSDRLGKPRLWSLPNKLALLFIAGILVAFGVLYFFVVPELESNLREQRMDEVSRVASGSQKLLDALADETLTANDVDRQVRSIADAAGARLTIFGSQRSLDAGEGEGGDATLFYVVSDSREENLVPRNRTLANRARSEGRLVRGGRRFRGEELGQIAQPIPYRGRFERVAVYSREFDDVTQTVSFVQDRLLVAGGVALLIAMVGGYAVALSVARRVRRLEEAAVQVAAGKHVDPLPVDSQDELGQLTQAFNEMQEQLRRVEVARREFVATASHELRTPIFSLGGFVELLRDEEIDEEVRREFLDAMAEQVERLQKLAADLLDLSRLDAGPVALDIEQVDLAEVVRAVSNEFTPKVREQGATLDLRLPPEGVAASCDRQRVAQIVRILIDNALRHTGDEATVEVTVERGDTTTRLVVSDDGPGLPDDIPVFDRFVTGDAARGAGLGLAIAAELAERMGGSLRASNGSAGAAFTLALPGVGWPTAASG